TPHRPLGLSLRHYHDSPQGLPGHHTRITRITPSCSTGARALGPLTINHETCRRQIRSVAADRPVVGNLARSFLSGWSPIYLLHGGAGTGHRTICRRNGPWPVVMTNCDDKSYGLCNTAKMPESQGRLITIVSGATAGGRVRPIQEYCRNPPGTLAQLNIM